MDPVTRLSRVSVGTTPVVIENVDPQVLQLMSSYAITTQMLPAGAGILDHIHMHVVPRWNGDTNFMTVVGRTRVLPEELPEVAAKLRPVFEKLR